MPTDAPESSRVTWSAPPLQPLLESRLQSARLDLFNDPRLSEARAKGAAPEFTATLIEEKLGAAARSGLDAVEASLRLAASEVLRTAAVPPETARDTLRKAGEHLTSPKGLVSNALPWSPSPLQVAAGVFVLWAVLMGGAGGALTLPWWANVLAVLSALIPARLAQNLYTEYRARLQRRQINELPARVCRLYIAHYNDALSDYELAVNALLGDAPPKGP